MSYLDTTQTINIGTTANDGTGDNIRSAMTKINNTFSNIQTFLLETTNFTTANVELLNSTSITVSANILPVANVTANIGSTSSWFNSIYGNEVYSQHADLAEKYESDSYYPCGTVVVFGGESEITIANLFADTRVAGVISTNPAYIMNNTSATGLKVALRGKVPVKVIGPVTKGDLLVSSTTPGFAASIDQDQSTPLAVFAKSLVTDLSTGEKLIFAVII